MDLTNEKHDTACMVDCFPSSDVLDVGFLGDFLHCFVPLWPHVYLVPGRRLE